MYKNQITRLNENEEENGIRRSVDSWNITLKSRKLRKIFRINAPAIKGYKSAQVNSRSAEFFFSLIFSGGEGILSLMKASYAV